MKKEEGESGAEIVEYLLKVGKVWEIQHRLFQGF